MGLMSAAQRKSGDPAVACRKVKIQRWQIEEIISVSADLHAVDGWGGEVPVVVTGAVYDFVRRKHPALRKLVTDYIIEHWEDK
jgi:hypothetical protein